MAYGTIANEHPFDVVKFDPWEGTVEEVITVDLTEYFNIFCPKCRTFLTSDQFIVQEKRVAETFEEIMAFAFPYCKACGTKAIRLTKEDIPQVLDPIDELEALLLLKYVGKFRTSFNESFVVGDPVWGIKL